MTGQPPGDRPDGTPPAAGGVPSAPGEPEHVEPGESGESGGPGEGGGPAGAEPAPEPEPEPVRVPRLRAPRTAAAAVVATAVLVLGVALLYDAIAVRTGHPARRWRAETADELATRHLDDTWVLLGAGVAVLLGGWLLWLAFAPGLRRWLPLRPRGDTTAAIDKAGVRILLLDRGAGLPGVDHLTVQVGRRRAKATLVGPADPASVQRQLREELARVTLANPLRLDVRTGGHRGHGGAQDIEPGGGPGGGSAAGGEPGAGAGPAAPGPAAPGPGASPSGASASGTFGTSGESGTGGAE
ncbi:DUF6286 domain-containing protein [Kitasatospora sp. NPDC090091]|uniref:DUF6286 domain-containing protein n=1 Tax=Kitasatospora sp. NPDC090091 TaxID=3364081 RepID=UPI0038221ABE